MTLALPLGVAQAEPTQPVPGFAWSAPGACPDQEFVIAELEKLLGHPVATDLTGPLAFSVRVVAGPVRGFRARLLVMTGTDQRERLVEHEDCEQLARVVALIVALAIDPDAVRRLNEAETAGPTAPPQAPEATACRCGSRWEQSTWQKLQDLSLPCPAIYCPAPQPVRPCPRPRELWRAPRPAPRPAPTARLKGFLEAGLGAASGVLPNLGPTVSASAGLELSERWRLGLVGRYWIRQVFSSPDYPSVRTSVRMFSGGARVCGFPFFASWSVVGCLGPELGDYRAASLSGLSEGAIQRDRWFALLGSVGAYFPLIPHLDLGTSVDGGPVLERASIGATAADGAWVKLTEAKPFVGSFAVTLLFSG